MNTKNNKRMSNVVNPLQKCPTMMLPSLMLLLLLFFLYVGQKFRVINSGNINLFIYLLMRGGHSHCYIWTFSVFFSCVD